MKKIVLILSLFILSFGFSNAQNATFPSSASLLTSFPVTCSPIEYSITWQTNCINHVFNNFSYNIIGSDLIIDINYTGSFACAGALSFPTMTATLNNVPVGTYTVKVQGNTSGSTGGLITLPGTLTVGSCCPVTSQISGSFPTYCIGDSISLTSNNNVSVTAHRWYKNGILASSTSNYSSISTQMGLDTFMLVVDTSTVCSDTTSVIINTLKNLKLDNDTVVCLFTNLAIKAPTGWTTYSWSNGSTSANIRSSVSNTYTLTTTAGSGCMQTDSIMVEHRGPLFSLGQDTTFCGGSSIDLIIDPLWATSRWIPSNDTNRTLNVDTAGIYVAEVTNNLGCVFQDAIKVTLSDTLIPIMGNDSICDGNTNKLYVNAGNTGITWSTGATTDTIEVTTSGTYTLTATASNNCPVSASAYTHFHALPPVNLGNDTSICQGDTITLVAGNGSEDYFWFNWVTAAQIDVWSAGTYSVKVTSPENCVKNDTITIAVAKCD
ncbi:MAG: hypothetical protein ACPGEG_08590, partial [Salibacteraceae bacterium]